MGKGIIASTEVWLQGIELNQILDKFEYIDPGKRILEKFQKKLIEEYPEIEQYATIKFEPGLRETFCLKITSSNRYCHIHFYENNKIPAFEFYWEDVFVFKFTLDNMFDSAMILKRWFCDNVMPSVLAREFPFLDKDELSEYSNFSKVIEADFIRSWDWVEQFYKEISRFQNSKEEILEELRFISQLRAKGYDRIFRAETSSLGLVLSRSMRHGLRMDQPLLIFEFSDDRKINIYMSIKACIGRMIKLSSSEFNITPQIESLLKEVETFDIK